MADPLPSTKRFFAEDYAGSPNWFNRFLTQLNLFTEPIYNIMNQGVDVNGNTNEEIYPVSIPNASATASSNTFLFTPKKFVGAPQGIVLGQCLLNSVTGTPSAIGNPVTFDWVWTGSQVKILAVYGLTSGSSYTLSLRIY